MEGSNISPDVTSDIINNWRNNNPHGNKDQIAKNVENKPINDRGNTGTTVYQSGRVH